MRLPWSHPELSFSSVDTRTSYVVDYSGEDGGKTAHYMLRWVARTGEKGRGAKRRVRRSGRSEMVGCAQSTKLETVQTGVGSEDDE